MGNDFEDIENLKGIEAGCGSAPPQPVDVLGVLMSFPGIAVGPDIFGMSQICSINYGFAVP